MNCLGVAEYDPAALATKTLAAAAAMVAVDTTHLRITFTVPTSGKVQARVKCVYVSAASAAPATFLLGVLEGATIRLRAAPMGGPRATAVAGAFYSCEASGVITGLTPGNSLTWDAAYGVETVTSGNIDIGGPDDTTAANAVGAFQFEIFEA